VSSQPLGAFVAAVICVLLAPYLAALTRTVPDRERRQWWRPDAAASPSRNRTALTALAGAILGALGGAAAGWTPVLPAFVLLAAAGAPLVVIDYEQHRLPDRLVGVAAVGAAVLLVVAAATDDDWTALLHAVEGAAAVFAVLLALALAVPNGFGLGDVKLGGVIGAFLGWFGWRYVFYGIFAGFLLGSIVGLAILAARRGNRKTAIAFGPMLLAGPLLVLAFDLVPTAIA
jgi:leader peptidase (prepilin peptidase)/N-methyltransferase